MIVNSHRGHVSATSYPCTALADLEGACPAHAHLRIAAKAVQQMQMQNQPILELAFPLYRKLIVALTEVVWSNGKEMMEKLWEAISVARC